MGPEFTAAENVVKSSSSGVPPSLMTFSVALSLILSWWNSIAMLLCQGRASHVLSSYILLNGNFLCCETS